MNDDLSASFIEVIVSRAITGKARINHCLDQIDTEKMWMAPAGANSIGIILQHLIGNLKQWVLAGLGGQPDTRERREEFVAHEAISLEEMRAAFNATMHEAISTYRGVPAARLRESVMIQGMQQTVMGALFNTVCHLELHGGQVMMLTKQAIPGRYREFWRPHTKEQGA